MVSQELVMGGLLNDSLTSLSFLARIVMVPVQIEIKVSSQLLKEASEKVKPQSHRNKEIPPFSN